MSEKDEGRERRPAKELSYQATVNRQADIADEIRRVANKDQLTPEDDSYLADLEGEFDELEEHRKDQEREALVARVDASTGRPLKASRGHTPERELDDDPFGEPRSVDEPGVFGNPWDEAEMRTFNRTKSQIGSEYRARALSAIEKASGTNDERRKAMTKIIEQYDDEKGTIAQLALRTSHPDYMRAFNKLARGGTHLLSVKEQQAVERAMSLTDSAGGYLVPFQLDPTVIITSDGSLNEIRQVARQVVATGDVWNGVSSGAVSWSWDGEVSEVSDDATTFAQPSINIHKAAGFVPISIEALQDEQNVAQEVGRLLAFGKDTHDAAAFATGSGSGQPTGIVTALNGVTASVVSATTNNSFGSEDVYKVQGDLPARYRARASWLANNAIYNEVRQFDTSGGAQLWERIGADRPALLLGRRAYESEDMDGALATGDDYVLVFGDFSNYVIADRIGTQVEFIPHLFSTGAGRPTGQRGWYAYYRVGADSVNDGAFRLLKV